MQTGKLLKLENNYHKESKDIHVVLVAATLGAVRRDSGYVHSSTLMGDLCQEVFMRALNIKS